MANKDENQNSRQLFSEDITKRLVKKILDENISEDEEENEEEYTRYSRPREENTSFNIEYEDYENQSFQRQEEERQPKKTKKVKSVQPRQSQPKNNEYYRKNIDKYGKDFFDDDFDDDEDDEDSPSIIGRVIAIGVILVLTISTAFLAINLKLTKNELTATTADLEQLKMTEASPEAKITEESLKTENEELKAENESLKQQLDPNYKPAQTENKTPTPNNTTTNTSPAPSNNSSSTEYIVKEGDVIWNISKKVYGNGAYYQKILDANNLTENSVLKPGQKLIIPQLN